VRLPLISTRGRVQAAARASRICRRRMSGDALAYEQPVLICT
jgi:hypothetical protein